jgi:hypothetical protein
MLFVNAHDEMLLEMKNFKVEIMFVLFAHFERSVFETFGFETFGFEHLVSNVTFRDRTFGFGRYVSRSDVRFRTLRFAIGRSVSVSVSVSNVRFYSIHFCVIFDL